MNSFRKPQTKAEWPLPDVMPGVCRLFLSLPGPDEALTTAAFEWQEVLLDETALSLFCTRQLLANGTLLEGVFVNEPTLDQLDALQDFACRLEQRGMPTLIEGWY